MIREYDDPFEVWQPWFAWRPIWIGYTKIWWEQVERRLKVYGHDVIWEYRLPRPLQPVSRDGEHFAPHTPRGVNIASALHWAHRAAPVTRASTIGKAPAKTYRDGKTEVKRN